MPILKRPSLLLLLLLGACATAPSKKPTASSFQTTAQTFVFACSDSFEFVARTDNKEAWLFLPSGTMQLPYTEAGSYRNDQTHFQIDGQEASLENSGVKHLGCKNDRRQAIWEHAKLNGADYRAVTVQHGMSLDYQNLRLTRPAGLQDIRPKNPAMS